MRGSLICSLFLLIALCGAVSAAEFVRLTVLYDNYLYNESLHTAWGFACLVEVGKRTILFDTGGDAETLLSNLAALGIAPHRIEIVVLFHIHGDHVGGLFGLLELNNAVTVYLPASFPSDFKERVRACGALVVEVQGPMELVPGVWSTGEMGTWIKEQALVVQTSKRTRSDHRLRPPRGSEYGHKSEGNRGRRDPPCDRGLSHVWDVPDTNPGSHPILPGAWGGTGCPLPLLR